MQDQQKNQDKPTTLQDALQRLSDASSLEQVQALCDEIDEGFVANIPTVQFADADWPMWSDAILKKVQFLETPSLPNLCRDAIADLIQRELAESGWEILDQGQNTAIAKKIFQTVVGRKEALVYLSKGDGFNLSLSGNYLSEGKNVLERGVLIPVESNDAEVKRLAKEFSTQALAWIRDTYAMRLTQEKDRLH